MCEWQAGKKAVSTLACVCKCQKACLLNRAGSSCLSHPSLKLHQCLMISLWSYAAAHRVSAVPSNLGEDKCRAGESFIIEINASAHGKWEDNVIITPQASCFYFSICLLSFCHVSGGHMAYCWCVCACLALPVLCVCPHMKGCKYSSENPIKGDMCWFAVLFKAFWDISMDISFNVRAKAENKLICFYPPSSLAAPSFTCFGPSLSLYIRLRPARVLLSVSPLFSSRCFCKM